MFGDDMRLIDGEDLLQKAKPYKNGDSVEYAIPVSAVSEATTYKAVRHGSFVTIEEEGV